MAKAGNVALSPSGRAGDAPAARGKPGKGNGSEGTPKDRGDSAAGTMPRVRPAQRFQAGTFTSSSSRTSQPSQGNAFAFWSIQLPVVQIWIPLALPVAERVFKGFQIHPVEFGWCLSEFETTNLGFYLKIEQAHWSLE